METIYQDIPRLYTAIAEWSGCLIYIFILQRRFSKRKTFFVCIAALLLQILVLVSTGKVPISLWLLCMIGAAVCMYVFIYICCELSFHQAAYCCATAFLIAEFAASLEWQIFTYLNVWGIMFLGMQLLIFILVYSGVFFGIYYLEKKLMTQEILEHLSVWDTVAMLGIVVVTFTYSNISFLLIEQNVSSYIYLGIFQMRTLADFAGLAVVYAFQSRAREYITEKEIKVIQSMLTAQYAQYRNYQESMELVRIQRHDLKHHIALLRAETDADRQKEWLDMLEETLNSSENAYPTGNRVVDGVLASKMGLMKKNKIQFTCVADGKLLDFIHVIDICTIFGNAIDNAIESVVLLEDQRKRMIHLSVSAKKNFVFIQVCNYCEKEPEWDENGELRTTKIDKKKHGYGLKSIRYSIEKYDGSVTVDQKNNWFELDILIPIK